MVNFKKEIFVLLRWFSNLVINEVIFIRDLFNNDGWSHPLTGTCVEMIRISRNDIAI